MDRSVDKNGANQTRAMLCAELDKCDGFMLTATPNYLRFFYLQSRGNNLL